MMDSQIEYQATVQEHLAFINRVLVGTVFLGVLGLAVFGFSSSRVVQTEKASTMYVWVSVCAFSMGLGVSSLAWLPHWMGERERVRQEKEAFDSSASGKRIF